MIKQARSQSSSWLAQVGLPVGLDLFRLHVHVVLFIAFISYLHNHRQRSSTGGLCVYARGVDNTKIWQKSANLQCVTFHIGGLELYFGGKPTKATRGDGTGTNRHLFWKLCCQTMPGGT